MLGAIALVSAAGTSQPAGAGASAVTGNAITLSASPSRLATRSLMLGIALAGDRLVAVGERGRVLLSDDVGASWRQAKYVPVSTSLTAVEFVDSQKGWAVGHAGVVLHTADGGETWQLQLDGVAAAQLALKAASAQPEQSAVFRNAQQLALDGPDKPFLALHFSSPQSGLVVGAYGLIFSTADGGASWQPRMADVDNPKGLHLNAVRAIGSQVYIAGERGLLLRSDDGRRFNALKSPYEGSLFVVDAVGSSGVVVAGLRGHAFVSGDAGASWQKVDGTAGVTFNFSKRLRDATVLLLDQTGGVYVLDASRRLTALKAAAPAPVTAVVQATGGEWVATTFRGPTRLLAAPAEASGR